MCEEIIELFDNLTKLFDSEDKGDPNHSENNVLEVGGWTNFSSRKHQTHNLFVRCENRHTKKGGKKSAAEGPPSVSFA